MLAGETFETEFVRLIPLIESLASVLQTVMVSANCSTTPLNPGTRLTAQLLVRVSEVLVVIEHVPVPSPALHVAIVPSGLSTTVQGPPLNAAPQTLPLTEMEPWFG